MQVVLTVSYRGLEPFSLVHCSEILVLPLQVFGVDRMVQRDDTLFVFVPR